MATPNSDGQEVLIDGQQRAIAIHQGLTDWNKDVSFRLWLDIDPKERQNRKEHTVLYFFFLCTRGFPWGSGISDGQRRKCREELERTHPDQIKTTDKSKPDYLLSLGYTWPARASLPIPFATMARWFIDRFTVADSLAIAHWPRVEPLAESDITHHVHKLLQSEDGCIVALNIRDRWKNNRDKIVEWVRKNQAVICRALNRRVYFELAFEGIEAPEPEDLGEAFNRINRLGVRLDGTDLFFSALKLRSPETHNFV